MDLFKEFGVKDPAAAAAQIPIIDFAPLFGGEPGALGRLAPLVRQACEQVGFFYAAGHGVPNALIERAFAASRRFHALPLDEKLKLRLNENNIGYLSINASVQGASTVLEADLPTAGTYRISTGEQLGNVTTLVGVDGQWRPLGQGEAVPPGAQTTTLQTVTIADVYVTRGAASREVLDRPNGRLAIRPITHPNQVLASQGFQVEVLYWIWRTGCPVSEVEIVYRDRLYGESKLGLSIVLESLALPWRLLLSARGRRGRWTVSSKGPHRERPAA